MANDDKRPFLRPGLLRYKDSQRLAKAVELVVSLTQETRYVRVEICDLGRTHVGMQILGQCSIGYLDIELSPTLFRRQQVDYKEFMPVLRRHNISLLTYTLMHEFGHARDFRRASMARWEQGRCPSRIGYFSIDGREQYAETFTEWHLSKGRTADPATVWYAQRSGWRTQW